MIEREREKCEKIIKKKRRREEKRREEVAMYVCYVGRGKDQSDNYLPSL